MAASKQICLPLSRLTSSCSLETTHGAFIYKFKAGVVVLYRTYQRFRSRVPPANDLQNLERYCMFLRARVSREMLEKAQTCCGSLDAATGSNGKFLQLTIVSRFQVRRWLDYQVKHRATLFDFEKALEENLYWSEFQWFAIFDGFDIDQNRNSAREACSKLGKFSSENIGWYTSWKQSQVDSTSLFLIFNASIFKLIKSTIEFPRKTQFKLDKGNLNDSTKLQVKCWYNPKPTSGIERNQEHNTDAVP